MDWPKAGELWRCTEEQIADLGGTFFLWADQSRRERKGLVVLDKGDIFLIVHSEVEKGNLGTEYLIVDVLYEERVFKWQRWNLASWNNWWEKVE